MALVSGLRQHGVTAFRLGDFEAEISPLRPVPRDDSKTHAQNEEDRRRELLASVM